MCFEYPATYLMVSSLKNENRIPFLKVAELVKYSFIFIFPDKLILKINK